MGIQDNYFKIGKSNIIQSSLEFKIANYYCVKQWFNASMWIAGYGQTPIDK